MKIKQAALFFVLGMGVCTASVYAEAPAAEPQKPTPFQQDVREFVDQLTAENQSFRESMSKKDFKAYKKEQHPRATVVACSDSRVQADAYNQSAVNDLFFIRNIGNQIQSNEGSVEYGVEHLKTPILLIIGHSHCGAVKTAMGDYSKLSKPIKRELDTLDLLKGNDVDEGVLANVHNQVQYAVKKYKDKIDNNKLIVMGLVYDFRDDFGEGHGRIILIDVNGIADPERIREMAIIKGNSDLAIGESRIRQAPAPDKTAIPAEPKDGERTHPEKAGTE